MWSVLTALGDLGIEGDTERRIELCNSGVFEVKKRKAKPAARNPRTNETVVIPRCRKTLFRPGKCIEEVLNTPLCDLGDDLPDDSVEKGGEEPEERAYVPASGKTPLRPSYVLVS